MSETKKLPPPNPWEGACTLESIMLRDAFNLGVAARDTQIANDPELRAELVEWFRKFWKVSDWPQLVLEETADQIITLIVKGETP